jgi:hypothetical protein
MSAPIPMPAGIQKLSSPGKSYYLKMSGGPGLMSAEACAPTPTATGPFATVGATYYYAFEDVATETKGVATAGNSWKLGVTILWMKAHDTDVYALDDAGQWWSFETETPNAAWTSTPFLNNVRHIDIAESHGFVLYSEAGNEVIARFALDEDPLVPTKFPNPGIDLSKVTALAMLNPTTIYVSDHQAVYMLTVTRAESGDALTLTKVKVADLPQSRPLAGLYAVQKTMNSPMPMGTKVDYLFAMDTQGLGYFVQPKYKETSPFEQSGVVWLQNFTSGLAAPQTPLRLSHMQKLNYWGQSADGAQVIMECNPCHTVYLDAKGPASNGNMMLPNKLFEIGKSTTDQATFSFYTNPEMKDLAGSISVRHEDSTGMFDKKFISTIGDTSPATEFPIPIKVTDENGTALLVDFAYQEDGVLIVGEIDLDPQLA